MPAARKTTARRKTTAKKTTTRPKKKVVGFIIEDHRQDCGWYCRTIEEVNERLTKLNITDSWDVPKVYVIGDDDKVKCTSITAQFTKADIKPPTGYEL